MKKCRITVMRMARYDDLSALYENPIEHACDMQLGQTFVANGWQKPEGFCQSAWDTLSPKLAPAEDVRGALALVERNEAPLGIVYGSDAVASKGVKVVATFPEDSHKKVEYPVAVVEGHNNATVKAFYDYLKGPQAAEIFKRYGFTIK